MSDAVTFPDPRDARRLGDSLRASLAGNAAVRAAHAAIALFERGGHRVLGEAGRAALAQAAERVAASAALPARIAESAPVLTARGVAVATAETAARSIARSAGRAAGVGFVLDAGIASFSAVRGVRAGTMTTAEAARLVAVEGATGALATGAGVLLGAGLVALTGGVAGPVVFAVGALGSTGVKHALGKATARVTG